MFFVCPAKLGDSRNADYPTSKLSVQWDWDWEQLGCWLFVILKLSSLAKKGPWATPSARSNPSGTTCASKSTVAVKEMMWCTYCDASDKREWRKNAKKMRRFQHAYHFRRRPQSTAEYTSVVLTTMR